MDSRAEVKSLLSKLADEIDGPSGPGGGAICLAALAEIETLESQVTMPQTAAPPAEPCSS